MTRDGQARARLVEIALATADAWTWMGGVTKQAYRDRVRREAGFRDPSRGHWCAAGLTAAMEDAGLLVPAPGTPARRGAVALLDCIGQLSRYELKYPWPVEPVVEPGDIIAWKQRPKPQEWAGGHAFATQASTHSLCGMHRLNIGLGSNTKRCSSCVWETRKGHVAVIVAVDDESITTVGWNEGKAPGRVMKRRLWRDAERCCVHCGGTGVAWRVGPQDARLYTRYQICKQVRRGARLTTVPRSSTVPYRRPGGIYGVARPVAA